MHLWPNSLNSLQVCWWCYTLNNNNIDLIPVFRKCMFFSQVCWWCPAREDQCHCRSRAQGGILPFLSLCLFLSNYGIQECLLFRDRATSASGAHMSREWWSSGGWWRSSTSVIRTKPTAASNETDRDVSSAALKKYWTPWNTCKINNAGCKLVRHRYCTGSSAGTKFTDRCKPQVTSSLILFVLIAI